MINRNWLKRDKYGIKYGVKYLPQGSKRVEIFGQRETEHEMEMVEADCPHCGGKVLFGLAGCIEATWLVFQRCDCPGNRVRSIIRVDDPSAIIEGDLWPTANGVVWPAQ